MKPLPLHDREVRMSNDFRVSVIICAYTMARWEDLSAAIDSLRQQTHRPDDIVLVIDHSDALLARVRQEGWIDVLAVANRYAQGLSGSRNTGIAVARYDLLAFLDDDAIAAPDWLAQYLEHAAAPDVLGCTGTIAPRWVGARPRWFPNEFLWTVGCSYRGQPTTPQPVRNVLGASMLIKRTVFETVGGFSNHLGRSGGTLVSCEETEMCIRGGAAFPASHFLFVPAAIVAHKVPAHRLTWAYFCCRCFAEGRSKVFVARLANQRGALDTEGHYVLRTLTSGVLRGLADIALHNDPAGIARAAAIIIGLGITVCGFLSGKLRRPQLLPAPTPALRAIE
jgi:glucosyl-dolichyl phosphate glucuronosyltransferase